MRIIKFALAGAIVGLLFGLVVLPFRPEDVSAGEILFLFAFGLGCLGMAVGAFSANR